MNTTTNTSHESALPIRRNNIDWLRIIAVLLLFPFHTARIFNLDEQFYVKSATLSKPLLLRRVSWAVAHALPVLPGRGLHLVRPLPPGRRSLRS